ncbi:D-galacturonate reductase [Diplogelasinospora grovesii]|uniref:D-galacturonate reductase n=1 Tax=Diplogelasinospora grovesii TaxID=303347 RepID=A0AAN6NF03_9PEZI|nr:D-galacturonate reductase [Diplogelasinospora grovesii]
MGVAINDRTAEFRHIVSAAKRRQATKPGSQRLLNDSQKAAANGDGRPRRSEFARKAADIGRGISATMAKLEKLAQLAKKKTLFDDRPVEINELTFIIKQDLSALNEEIRNLQALSKRLHPKPDQEGENNKNILLLLQGKLGDVSANFKDVLEIRTKNIQASRSRTEAFVSTVGQHALVAPQHSASPLYGTPNRGTPSPGADLISLNPVSSVADQQLQLQMMEEGQNTYIQQRGQAIEAIESTINELGSIFGQLAAMVSEQSEMIQRIDANTEDVVDNVEGAQKELLRYWSRVSGNRWLLAKMFGVLPLCGLTAVPIRFQNSNMADKTFKLNTGREIPALGLGTWQSEPGKVKEAVAHALKSGYRLIDCAYCYGNEDEVGQGLKEAFAAGVKREDIFVVTKVWATYNTRVELGLDKSLKSLGLDYVDLFLVHWPLLMNPEGNDDRFPKLPDGSRDIIRSHNHVDTWKQMEQLLPTGKTLAIGVSNYSKRYLEQLLPHCKVVPAVNQIENHPQLPQQEIVDLCRQKGIHIMAYSPFGSTGGPLFKAEPVLKVAEKHGVSPSTVLLSWHIPRGSTVLAKSVTPERITANKELVDLDDEDTKLLNDYADKLTSEGKVQRYVYPPFGVDFGFPDKS